MPLLNPSEDLFIGISLISITIWIFFLRPRNSTRLRVAVSALILAHSLFILHTVITYPPPNIFTSLNIRFTIPSDSIRTILRQNGDISPALDALLSRLSSFDERTLYIRYGHNVMLDCSYCQTPFELAIHALPPPLLQYTRTAAVIGIATLLGTGRERWRVLGIGAIIAAAAAEIWWVAATSIEIPPDGSKPAFMIHDDLYRIRHIFFLLLPIIISILPKRFQSPSPLQSLPVIHNALNQTLTRTHLAGHARATLMRAPSLRDRAVEWWNTQSTEGEYAREDETVQETADQLGMGYREGKTGQEGPLRVAARGAVDGMLINGMSSPVL